MINRLSKMFPPLVNPACSNFSILFSAMCFFFFYFSSYRCHRILYDASFIAIGLSSVSVGLFFFSNVVVFDFIHSVGSCPSSSTFS